MTLYEAKLAIGFAMFAISAALAHSKIQGWGWFLFATILVMA